jgi:hypothetical protein
LFIQVHSSLTRTSAGFGGRHAQTRFGTIPLRPGLMSNVGIRAATIDGLAFFDEVRVNYLRFSGKRQTADRPAIIKRS